MYDAEYAKYVKEYAIFMEALLTEGTPYTNPNDRFSPFENEWDQATNKKVNDIWDSYQNSGGYVGWGEQPLPRRFFIDLMRAIK